MRVKCYSVRFRSFYQITPKAYKAESFNGRSCIIPASQVYDRDYEVFKSEAWWISAWILSRSCLQFSTKKEAWFDSETRDKLPRYIVEKHNPAFVEPVENNDIDALRSDKGETAH